MLDYLYLAAYTLLGGIRATESKGFTLFRLEFSVLGRSLQLSGEIKSAKDKNMDASTDMNRACDQNVNSLQAMPVAQKSNAERVRLRETESTEERIRRIFSVVTPGDTAVANQAIQILKTEGIVLTPTDFEGNRLRWKAALDSIAADIARND